jgi:hypothetical protein
MLYCIVRALYNLLKPLFHSFNFLTYQSKFCVQINTNIYMLAHVHQPRKLASVIHSDIYLHVCSMFISLF